MENKAILIVGFAGIAAGFILMGLIAYNMMAGSVGLGEAANAYGFAFIVGAASIGLATGLLNIKEKY